MPLHVKRITGDVHFEIRVFKPGAWYGDGFDVGLNAVVKEDCIEVTMMSGALSRPVFQVKELLDRLRELGELYDMPVIAQRKEGVLPGFVHLCGDWWILK